MWHDFRNELLKMFYQKKNYVMVFGHLLLLGLCYIGFKTSKMSFLARGIKHQAEINISDLMSYMDALFFARTALLPTYFIIFPIFICTVAGDIVAGEIQDGSLKLLASRPRSRSSIILSKLFATAVFSWIYSLYFAIANLIIGFIFFGKPGVQLVYLHGMDIDTVLVVMPLVRAIVAYALSVAYFSVSILALGAITVFLSTLFDRMTTATVSGITFYFVCYIVGSLPFAAEIKPYLLSTAMNGIAVFWMERMPVGRLIDSLCLIAIYIVAFAGMSIISFNVKDIR